MNSRAFAEYASRSLRWKFAPGIFANSNGKAEAGFTWSFPMIPVR